MIECKTAGNEFSKAWNKTEQDGDQLFSYAQQIPQVQFLCLYASDFQNNQIHFKYNMILHKDNATILEDNPKLMAYKESTDVKNRFKVWQETYQQEYTQKGIFEESIQPYQIGKNKYTLKEDTKPIDAIDQEGKYHEFRTILRKHNIARRENAFEVLVNLFLCKIVDEEEHQTELKFYWKGIAYDNYFDFVDRLQSLYQRGMDKFLAEEITYISNQQIEDAFWTVKNNKNATKKQIQKYFRQLKFFTNSAFSFIDTYNEKLFIKNVKVLLEIVQMWQGTRLKTKGQNQFLGDMFEYFLDNSIKQSNGQFFTPLPICKFIVSALPLEQKISQNKEPLKMIDFACGSGHFLNEYAHQIKPLVEQHKKNLQPYYENITGIEKEDRLAKVSKVAAFMYGQDPIKILDIDALGQHREIKKESYDVLVANPPFAVEGFLQTLNEEDRQEFELISQIAKLETNTIQCFFLERMQHLMKGDGVVGVIVPSSILSNGDKVHIKTRELLLQYFDVVSIVEFGSGTFGKTGTNTVVLFLRRKNKKPEEAEHYHNRALDFFEGDTKDNQKAYLDKYFIKAYCQYIQIEYKFYKNLFDCQDIILIKELLETDRFQNYKKDFEQSTEIKNLKKQRTFKNKNTKEQQQELDRRLINYLQIKEQDKLYYFILAYRQKVLIVNAPSNHKEHKQFLGYEWSGSKGKEGIKYYGGNTVNDISTPLFNPKNLNDKTKINTVIQNHFNGVATKSLPKYCRYAYLTDMLDFSRVSFDKTISLNPQENIEIQTQWKLVRLGEFIKEYDKSNIKVGDAKNNITGQYPFYTSGLNIYKYDNFLIENKNIFLSTGGKAIVQYFDGKASYSTDTFVITSKDENKLLTYYLFCLLQKEINKIENMFEGIALKHLQKDDFRNLKIPLPSLEVQQKIVTECEAIDKEVEKASQTIEQCKNNIEKEVQTVIDGGHEMKDLEKVCEDIFAGGDVPKDNFSTNKTDVFKIPIFSNGIENKGLYGYTNKARVEKPSITISARGTIGHVELRQEPFYPIIRLIVIIPKNDIILIDYLKLSIKTIQIVQSGGVIPQLTVPMISKLQIPLPPLNIQKELVTKIEPLEQKINDSQSVLDGASERKEEVLEREL